VRNETLPDWYNITDTATTMPLHSTPRKVDASVRRALAGFGEALARELSSSPCTESWLGSIEPRAKIAGLFALVFASTFLQSIWSLAALFALILVLALSIRLPVRPLAHVWLGVPLFSLAIILPATTNLVTPGASALSLWHFGHAVRLGPWIVPETITITYTGLVVAGRFLLRSVDCVTLCYLLVATTDSVLLLNGMRRLGMPKVFGMILTMAQRYLAGILRVAEEIHLAKLSRTIASGPLRNEQRWVAAGIGMLFRKTHKLAHEVQNAMISRGYDGDLQVRSQSVLHTRDIVWLIGLTTLTSAIIIFDRLCLRSLH
jgi:cobalt/nickel transport system permease protein